MSIDKERPSGMDDAPSCFRCGYCGRQTNEQGGLLSEDEVSALDKFGVDWDKADPVQGDCCTKN